MKKSIIAALMLLPFAANAATTEVKLGGKINAQVGVSDHKGAYRYTIPGDENSGRLDKTYLVNDTKLKVSFTTTEGLINVGGYITLNADTSTSKTGSDASGYEGAVRIAHDQIGQLSAGTEPSPSDVLKTYKSLATGGIDGDYVYYLSKYSLASGGGVKNADKAFLRAQYLPVGSDYSSKANGVNFYTPTNKYPVAFGIGYTPDSRVRGTISEALKTSTNSGEGYRHIYDGGFKFQSEKIQDAKFEMAFLGQIGKAVTTNNVKRHNLKAWEIGIAAESNGFRLGGSYGDWGKSGTKAVGVAGHKYGAKYYTVTAQYAINQAGFGLSYLSSKRGGGDITIDDAKYNRYKAIAASLEYKLAPGAKPYFEFVQYDHKASDTLESTVRNDKGSIVLAGVMLEF
jgi:hypothetical protein